MLNTISEQDLQQQGWSVIENAIRKGAVHILHNNRPRYVVLTEESYQNLTQQKK
jgi:PHD/YefM family antitoxin component YafN of YafNO toxin-antitoxin module